MKPIDWRAVNAVALNVQTLLVVAATACAIGYFGCWLDESPNRHKYTNRTVSADVAATPTTPPGERSPPTAVESNAAGDGRQRAAAWLAWLIKPERLLNLAASIAFATWVCCELIAYLREREQRRRNTLTLYVEGGDPPTRKEIDR